jgi:hypothetical protein
MDDAELLKIILGKLDGLNNKITDLSVEVAELSALRDQVDCHERRVTRLTGMADKFLGVGKLITIVGSIAGAIFTIIKIYQALM